MSNEKAQVLVRTYDGLAIKNSDLVSLEPFPERTGRIIKTHIPEHGDVTYDVEIEYEFNPEVKKERLRLRDIPGRCLIKRDRPNS